MTDPVQFMEENRQGVTIVHIVNQRLIEPRLSDDLTRRLCGLIDEGVLLLLIDMGAVQRISSVFFRSFILAGKKADAKKVKIAFCGLSPVINEGFHVTGMDKLFNIYDSEGRAISGLTGK